MDGGGFLCRAITTLKSAWSGDNTMVRHRPSICLGSIALTFLLTLMSVAQTQPQATGTTSSPNPPAATDDAWHFDITPYLWFASANGTVGALGRDASVNASFGDIFSKLNIGLMGVFEARKKRLILNTDFMWLKLSDDSALPINEFGVQSIKAKATQFLLTPKAGYQIVDREKIKVAGTLGIRYWHLSNDLTLQPQIANGISDSANWVDVVAGARIQVPLSPKALVTVLGDAGGGGANSDYQVAGLLGYKFKKKFVLQGGWRYLSVNYRPQWERLHLRHGNERSHHWRDDQPEVIRCIPLVWVAATKVDGDWLEAPLEPDFRGREIVQ